LLYAEEKLNMDEQLLLHLGALTKEIGRRLRYLESLNLWKARYSLVIQTQDGFAIDNCSRQA
jgi:hypothetical protein